MRVGLIVAALLTATLWGNVVSADDGHPVAIRHWPGQGFTVETMWGFCVGVGLNDETRKIVSQPIDVELEKLPGLAGDTCFLERKVNSDKLDIHEHTAPEDMQNVAALSISKLYETKQHRDARPLWDGTSFSVDGVSVYFLDHDRVDMESRMARMGRHRDSKAMEPMKHVAVVATGEQFTAEFCKEYASVYKPQIMIISVGIEKVGDKAVEKIAHNTLAFSLTSQEAESTRFVSLGTNAYEMKAEVAELFAKKETAQKATRDLFASLSLTQMNFKPSNGSHTPRWNSEHMMGRELLFFSQIYNAVDPSIPVMNLNPKQMPKDYEFAHEDWTGEEEARQTERVQNFTRRFAYMLDGMDLDKRAKGSRFWSPRALLKQMERHYYEHSANVRKKMELEDWPK